MSASKGIELGPLGPSPEPKDANGPVAEAHSVHSADQSGKLYKHRFLGLIGLTILNLVGGLAMPYFGPVSTEMSEDFHISLDRVNWLGNIVACVFLPVSLLIPFVIAKYGIRVTCYIGGACLLIGSWVRYAGTAKSLSPNSAYALLIIGQTFHAVSQPIYQVLAPKYSELWFSLQGRTTATMVISIANPIGGALGQIISPAVGNTRRAILVLGIISSASVPCVLLIAEKPPTPPTYSARRKSHSISSLMLAWFGRETTPDAHMSMRERVDFAIITFVFGVLVGVTNTFAVVSEEIFEPVGYSSNLSGLFGACMLLTGIVAAVITSPLFDHVFTHHLAVTAKIFVVCLAGAWLSLIWAVKPHDIGGIFAIMTILGVTSIPMLPVGLELACEVTRNADGSASVLWFSGNLFAVIFILADGALRAGSEADPPLNMHRALLFQGVFIVITAAFILFVRGTQVRSEIDAEWLANARNRALALRGNREERVEEGQVEASTPDEKSSP
ncbi:MFS general substrate transporter [Fistulina hepatica ATCC 64428]|uniref:MFS general substrate transporter n=1 Tax=Fistulina hepatica ATCC 64428 TaxID=1128425 RepID=A0A0D7A200_9AGAR|nr:MFS general substrate transporter [Fistulina hepatica ATCC 64428]